MSRNVFHIVSALQSIVCMKELKRHFDPSSRVNVTWSRVTRQGLYTGTFLNTKFPKMAKDHEISVYFSANAILALCQAPPHFRNSKCAGFQTKNLMSDEGKTFSGSLVLDLRI